MAELRQPVWIKAEDVPPLPKGWQSLPTAEACVQLKPGKLFDSITVSEYGDVPVLNQSGAGFLGYHDEEPGVSASPEAPVVTFANHTCAMRLMKQPFSSIQNIFPKVGKPGVTETVYFYYASLGRVELSDYKGHHPVFRQAHIPIPPLPIQRRIAGILSSYDELIENSQRRIKILESMARALYREWFVHFRFPGQESVPRVPSPLGEIPQGWRVGRLGTICESLTSGGTPRTSAKEYWDGGIPWLSSGETGNAFVIETEKTITAEGVSQSSTRFARAGCTVIASAGQGKTRGQTSLLCLDCYISQSVIALTADPQQISDNFLFLDLSGRYSQLRQISDGSSRGSLTTRLLAELEVVVPPVRLVHDFDVLVAPIVRSIEIGERRNKNLRRTRDLLLPRLLSGQIDVEAMPA